MLDRGASEDTTPRKLRAELRRSRCFPLPRRVKRAVYDCMNLTRSPFASPTRIQNELIHSTDRQKAPTMRACTRYLLPSITSPCVASIVCGLLSPDRGGSVAAPTLARTGDHKIANTSREMELIVKQPHFVTRRPYPRVSSSQRRVPWVHTGQRNQIQFFPRNPARTQVNICGTPKKMLHLDVTIVRDAREVEGI